MWGDIAIAFLLAFITAYVVTPYTIRFARKVRAVDIPRGNKRKIHKRVMPRLGGLAVIAGFSVSVIYLLIVMTLEGSASFDSYYTQLIGFFSGALVLSIFCFIDDLKGIPAIVKLLGQIIAACIVVFTGTSIERIELFNLSGTFVNNETFLLVFTVIWIVGITNAINLIDGLDGLSSGICLISCISLLIIFALNDSPMLSIILVTALAGAVLGFLPFNFNPARTFIGDTGSNFLGFALAIIAIIGAAKTYTAIVLIAPLIVLAVPLLDTALAIFRRIIKTKSLKGIFQADKEHLHHKIMKRGYSQKQAVFMLYGLTATLGMFAIILLESGIWKALSFALMVIAIIAVGYKDIMKLRKDEESD